MISRPIVLQHCNNAQRPACAWMIAGGDTSRWLSEITRWHVDESALKLYLLPQSRDNLSPSGLLVLGPNLSELSVRPAAIGYGLIGESIYIPIESILSPAMSEQELKALSRYDLLLFHPVLGPVGFDDSNSLRVADLLISPPRRADYWEQLIPSVQPNRHIRSVSFRTVPLLEEMFGEASNEIGVDSPKELSGPEKQFGAEIAESLLMQSGGRLLQGLSYLLRAFPHTGSQRTAFNSFEDWVNAHLRRVLQDVEKSRNKELYRLLEQLSNNPDIGLRHAIPLSQVGLNRGVAPKSGQLGERHSDFDLRRLRGGQAADFWNIPSDLRQQLRSNYLKLAERERQLGRYRRAAYIYAELLGDLSTAALILKEGRFFQDAAFLYRDHLRRPLEAADCFVEARMLAEAIAIYEKEQAWEALGGLYLKIGESDKASDALRKWVNILVEKGDLLQAFEILRHKLFLPDEAVKLLKESWPDHHQTSKCMERYFEYCAEGLEHESATEWLMEMDQRPLSPSQEITLLRLYIYLQSHYPDRELLLKAEDKGRVKIAKNLLSKDESERKQAVYMLAALAPDDRLLRRDGIRYLDQKRVKPASVPPPIPPKLTHRSCVPEIMHDFVFPQKGIKWIRAISHGDHFFAVGRAQGAIGIVRSSFDGHHQMEKWPMIALGVDGDLKMHLCADSASGQDEVYFRILYRNEIHAKVMPPTDVLGRPALVGTPGWLTDDPLAATFDPNGTFWLWRHIRTGLQLSSYQSLKTGIVRANLEIPFLEQEWVAHSVFGAPNVPVMAVLEHRILIGLGRNLHVLNISSPEQETEGAGRLSFEEDILAIVPGAKWTKPHVAIVLEHQVLICWLDGSSPQVSHVQTGLEDPLATFTNEGTLVVITPDKGYLFDCSSHGVRSSCQFERKREDVIAVIRGPEARSYATVESNGNVKTFKFSSGLLK